MTMYPQPGLNRLEYGYAETGERARLVTQFFHGVYLWMGIALLWTAIVSWVGANVPAFQFALSRNVGIACFLGAAVIGFLFGRITMRVPLPVAMGIFMLYATLIGLATSYIWRAYDQSTIGVAFVLTGGIFLVTSIVGFVTKMDLSRLHAIAIMIAIGLFAASVVNLFMSSDMISWLVTYAIVIVFPILMATQTQQLKEFALDNGDNGALAQRVMLVGALMLYISFINVFLALLRILGDRR